jgi:8-oxo-dGTP pyrophosphatase MutT (NUDIX family)
MGLETQQILEQIEAAMPSKRQVIQQADLLPAAVLVPIVFREAGPCFILTKRTMTVARHKGQISFPGGAGEAEDEDAAATALREAREEIGLEPNRVRVVGLLDDYATITGFLITPVLGIVDDSATFEPDPGEVDELFEILLSRFSARGAHGIVTGAHEGVERTYHCYTVDGRIVWGATAAIIHSFLSRLR